MLNEFATGAISVFKPDETNLASSGFFMSGKLPCRGTKRKRTDLVTFLIKS
jgi:hypothetical protein